MKPPFTYGKFLGELSVNSTQFGVTAAPLTAARARDDVAVRARIVSTSNVACEELFRSQITLYDVQVQQNDLAHVVRRRYSEFRLLHDALAREFGPPYANLIAGLLIAIIAIIAICAGLGWYSRR